MVAGLVLPIADEVRQVQLNGQAIRQPGGRTVLGYRIPTEDFEVFNRNLIGTLDVDAEFRWRPTRGKKTDPPNYPDRAT